FIARVHAPRPEGGGRFRGGDGNRPLRAGERAFTLWGGWLGRARLSARGPPWRRSPGQVVRCATPRLYPDVPVPPGHGLGGEQALARQRGPSGTEGLALRRQGVDHP